MAYDLHISFCCNASDVQNAHHVFQMNLISFKETPSAQNVIDIKTRDLFEKRKEAVDLRWPVDEFLFL